MTGDLFEEDVQSVRAERLRALMLQQLRQPWNPRQIAGIIPEPSDAEKVAFADAFVRASRPRIPIESQTGYTNGRGSGMVGAV